MDVAEIKRAILRMICSETCGAAGKTTGPELPDARV